MENYNSNKSIKRIFERLTHNWVQKVICVILAVVIVQIYNGSLLEKRYFSVHLEYKYSDTLVSSTILPRTVRVSVWGNSSIINSIRDEDIIARVDASNLNIAGEYKLPIQFIKNNPLLAAEAIELHAEPQEVKMKLEKKIIKTVDVKFAIDGTLPEDYAIFNSSIEPSKINIEGPISRVEKIEMITTDVVQINNRTADFEGLVQIINNDPLITILGQSDIQYKIEIKEKEIKKIFQDINIDIKNLDKRLEIATVIPKGEIIIIGPKAKIETFSKPRDILYIDLKNLPGEGEYTTIPVQTSSLNGLRVENYKPKSLRLIIKEKKALVIEE